MAIDKKIYFSIEGISCSSCLVKIEQRFKKMSAINSLKINPITHRAVIQATSISFDDIDKVIKELGYRAQPYNPLSSVQKQEKPFINRWELLIGILCAIPFWVVMISQLTQFNFRIIEEIQFILAIITLMALGRQYFIRAWLKLCQGTAGMETLISLSVGIAFITSCIKFFWQVSWLQHYYFDVVVAVPCFISIGKYLEEYFKQKNRSLSESLVKLIPQRCHLVLNGEIQDIDVEKIPQNATIRIFPEERIPFDGKVVKGEAEIDESFLTGESRTVKKEITSEVYAGSLQISGIIDILVEKGIEESRLAHIAYITETAQLEKISTQKLIDKISNIFIPLVLLFSILTFIIQYLLGSDIATVLSSTMAVLVIACPCALGLAIPLAFTVGTISANKKGIIFKNAEVLEKLGAIDTFIFDKTGTLTLGKPQVKAIFPDTLSTSDKKNIALATQYSQHVHSQAIHKYLDTPDIPHTVPQVKSFIGKGIEVFLHDKKLLIGNKKFIQEQCNADIFSPELLLWLQQHQQHSLVFVTTDNSLTSVFALQDTIKDTALLTIQTLKKHNIESRIFSGDKEGVVQEVAQQLQITNWKAEVSPEEKLFFAKELMQQGKKVAAIGDGINDAPMLATVDAGFSVMNATDITRETSSVSFIKEDLQLIVRAIVISRYILNKIYQNLFWAFIYNIVCIPIAMAGIFNPIFAGLAMSLSSLSIVINSVLFFRYKK